MKILTSSGLSSRITKFRIYPEIVIETDNVNLEEDNVFVVNVSASSIRFNLNYTWSIVGGADANKFTIDPETGELSFSLAPVFDPPGDADSDNTYIVKIRAKDQFNQKTEKELEITVISSITIGTLTDTNVSSNEIFDNAAAGTAVTGITWTHDITGSPMFELTDDAGGRFTIVPETGVVQRTGTGTLSTSHDITVKVSNENGDYATATVTITVNPAVAPKIISNGGGSTAEIEMTEGDTAVTTVQASAADLVFSKSGTDADDFNIDASTGVVTFASTPDYSAPTDADTNNEYLLTVAVTDGVRSDSQDLTITVTEVSAGIGYVPGTEITAMRTESMTTNGVTWADASGTYGQSLTGTNWWQLTHDGTTEGFLYIDPVDNSAYTGLGETYFVAMEVKKIAGNTVQPGINISSGPFPFADIHTSPSSPTIASGTGGVRQDLDDQYTIWMELPAGAVTENLFLHMGNNGDNSPSGVNALSGEAFLVGAIWLEAKGVKTEPTAVVA